MLFSGDRRARFYLPAIQLRPLAIVLVIAITAIAGYGWGIASGVGSALFFTAIEAYGGHRSEPTNIAWNTAFSALGLVAAVVLVEGLRSRINREKAIDDDLRGAHRELVDLKRINAAEAALRRSEQRYRVVGESLPFGVWQTSAAGEELTYISEVYCALFGMTREQIAAGGWRERVPEEDQVRFLAAWRARERQDVFEGEYRIRAKDGKTYWILSRGARLRDDDGATTGWAGFNLDITSRKRNEERFAFLADIGRTLASSLEPPIVLEKAANVIVPRFADWCTIDIVADDTEIERVLAVHRDPELTAAMKKLLPDPREAALFGYRGKQVIATGQPDWQRSPSGMARSDEQLELLKHMGLGSLISVPLDARGKTIGALTLVSRSDQRYEAEDVGFLTSWPGASHSHTTTPACTPASTASQTCSSGYPCPSPCPTSQGSRSERITSRAPRRPRSGETGTTLFSSATAASRFPSATSQEKGCKPLPS